MPTKVSPSLWLFYQSTDGHTQSLASELEKLGEGSFGCVFPPETMESLLKRDSAPWAQKDVVVLLASVRYGDFRSTCYQVVKKFEKELSSSHSGFVGVCLTARKPEKAEVANNRYAQKFLQKSSWKPKEMHMAAGVLDYQKYRFLDRHMIRLIMYLTGGPTETHIKKDYTNRSLLKAWFQSFQSSFE